MSLAPNKNMKKVIIKKGWFRSAGFQYKWIFEGYDVLGVGINREFFEDGKKLIVNVLGKDYELDCDEGRKFVRKFGSVMPLRNGSIGIVSKSLLKEIIS